VSRAAFFIDGAFSRFAGVNLGAIVVEHEQPQHRRKIGVMALFVDRRDEVRHRDVARRGDFLERIPECIFKAHAGRMPVYFDRSFSVQALPQAFHENDLRRSRRGRSANNRLGMLFPRAARRGDICGNLLPESYRSAVIVTAERAGLAISAWPRQMTTVRRIARPGSIYG
jgi:hypothetical protein